MVAPAHLEGFGNIENVARAKGEIVESLGEEGIFYVNNDNEWCRKIAQGYRGEKVCFGSSGDVTLESFEFTGPGQALLRVAPVGELRLPLACRAHAVNVLLAVAVGLRHGAQEFQNPLGEYCRNASRVKVASVGPLTVIDDSYNANPASMAAALEMLADWPCGGRRMAALGEMLELGESAAALHREIGEEAGRRGIEYLFAKGPHACDTIDGARSARVPHTEAMEDPAEIARAIHEAARPGDVLLVKGSRGMRMERVIEALRETSTQEH
jgi:UDP-N-acetylmuramoyl-tripeptide--D-alanyl-D-alanine ligase